MRPANHQLKRNAPRGGFTLIELLLVMVIIAILAAIVIPKFTGRTEQAKVSAATADIANLKTALNAFEIDNGRYPTSEEGLAALVTEPADLASASGSTPNAATGWKKLLDKVPNDPWGHPYVYRCPGSNGQDFDLLSTGPSGVEGGADNITE
ncbi:MAG: type II secretion system major pseudopilin GspG [Tepidisphaeraceae bacterium]|jgi:general secretion pathway protein G